MANGKPEAKEAKPEKKGLSDSERIDKILELLALNGITIPKALR